MGFLDNVFNPDKKKSKPKGNNDNSNNPFANLGKSIQNNFNNATQPKFSGQGQSLGGSKPGDVIEITLSQPGTLGIRIERRDNNSSSAIVSQIVPGSQAETAGLQRGDILCFAGSNGQNEINYEMFLEIAKSTQRPIYLEARRFTPPKSASGRGGTGNERACAEERRKAMSAAAAAREKAHKSKNKTMKHVTKTTLLKQQGVEDVNNFTSEELAPQTEASRAAMEAAKRDERNLANELGYNPYEAAKSTAGQARNATVTTQHGEISGGGTIPAVAPPTNPTSAVQETTQKQQHTDHELPEDFEEALVTIMVSGDSAASKNGLKIARTLITNATTKGQNPNDVEGSAKFRKVRLENAKIKKAIVEVPGNIQLMLSVGFQLVECDENNESLLVFPPSYKGPVWLPTAIRKMEQQEKAM